ncbi:MAG: type II secretion system protein GspC [Halioglobus sp.]|nr:type II secretion system protein GspC [Halioglobus sp.]
MASLAHAVADPVLGGRLRRVVLALLLLWAVAALSHLVWAVFPPLRNPLPETATVVNPVAVATDASPSVQGPDMERMRAWHLFGEVGADDRGGAPSPDPSRVAALEGIEKGARQTRLALKLRGVMASSEDGLGQAIIEYQAQQDVYAVDDKLPVAGQVVLAKVMPAQVVLDHGGTYELLRLFDESSLDRQLPAPAAALQRPAPPAPPPPAVQIDQRDAAETTALARSYRERLYRDPQSLAEVVSVSAVRENGSLLGYRIAPGRDREQFEQLGFRDGDLVTGVNGIALNDPANAAQLYRAMRTAGVAVFEVQRQRQRVTVSVRLDSSAAP